MLNIPSLIGTIAAAATTGVMIRSFDRPEAVRTATGAALVALSELLWPGSGRCGKPDLR